MSPEEFRQHLREVTRLMLSGRFLEADRLLDRIIDEGIE